MVKKKTLGKKARGAAIGFTKTAVVIGLGVVLLSTLNRKLGITDRIQGGLSEIGGIIPNAFADTSNQISQAQQQANRDRAAEIGNEQYGTSTQDTTPGQGTINGQTAIAEAATKRTDTRPTSRTSFMSKIKIPDYSAHPLGSTVTRNNLNFTTRHVSTLSAPTQRLIARSANKPQVVAVRTVKAGQGINTAAQRAYANSKIAANRANKRSGNRR